MGNATNSKPRYGQLVVKINANVYEGSTALCSSEDADCNNGIENGDEFDNNGNSTGGTTTTGGTTDIGGNYNPNTGTGGTSDFSGLTGSTGTSSNGSSGLLDNIFSGGAGSSGNSATNNANNPDWLSDGFSNIAQNNGDSTISEGFGSQFADQGMK